MVMGKFQKFVCI